MQKKCKYIVLNEKIQCMTINLGLLYTASNLTHVLERTEKERDLGNIWLIHSIKIIGKMGYSQRLCQSLEEPILNLFSIKMNK